MDPNDVIEVKDLYKKFTRTLKRSMFYGSTDVVKTMAGVKIERSTLKKGEFWALEDVSFKLRRGDSLGIIGENGSGKTTLLRLINGIFPPDRGSIKVKGSIGALIAVGAGFHPHMTGRENIYLNGTIFGMEKEEIEEKLQPIIDFADIGQFIDSPVATYSSGMTVRLGFAIAIFSNPSILIADEVLAVGDLGFALKCYRKIAEYKEGGGSLILVSHSIQLVRNTCQEVLWMEHGKVKEYGSTQEVCDHYEKYILNKDSKDNAQVGTIINNDKSVQITSVKFLDKDNKEHAEYKSGEPFKIRLEFECQRKINKPIFTVSISNPESVQVVSNYTKFDGFDIESLEGKGHLDFKIDHLALKPSQYKCTITFTENGDINNILEWHDKAHVFNVSSNGWTSYGLVNPFPKWELSLDKNN